MFSGQTLDPGGKVDGTLYMLFGTESKKVREGLVRLELYLGVTEFWDEINCVAFSDRSEELCDHARGDWAVVRPGRSCPLGTQDDRRGRHSLPWRWVGSCGDPRSH